jgi:LmbE family N-acetylglucosaminyl deacetylase
MTKKKKAGEIVQRGTAVSKGHRVSQQDIAREAGVSRGELIGMQDRGALVVWRSKVPVAPPTVDRPTTVIVSPHPDDAALSCGGRMLGTPGVVVLNAFSRTAWWRFAIGEAERPRIQATRAMEEELVSRLSGAEIRGLGLDEALLRGHAMESVFTVAPDQRDEEVARKVGEAVGEIAREHPLVHWYLPLGVGGHVDHRIVRDAAFAALDGVRRSHVHFYDDLPYAAKRQKTDFFERRPELRLVREELDIEEQVRWKTELLRAYWSQFTWGQLAEIERYARVAGERVAVAETGWGFGA